MNNVKQSNQTNEPLWVAAQSKHNENRKQKSANVATKKHYFDVLEEMKQLYKAKGDELAFERSYTLHPSSKINSIHCFLTQDFYWHLCCEDDYNFVILYNTGNLIFTPDFNKMCVFKPKSVRTKVIQDIQVPVMFKRCKRLQDSHFFTTL